MLAPAFEAVLDPTSQDHFERLRAARDRWAALPADLAAAVGLDRSGALWAGEGGAHDRIADRLQAIGAQVQRLKQEEAQALSPGLRAPAGAVFTPEDWRLDAGAALKALRGAFQAAGGEVRVQALREAADGAAVLADGERIGVEATVLATGMPPQGLGIQLPEAGLLQPIKGQIARIAGRGPRTGPAVRAEGVYVAPAAAGPAIGATMEQGALDRTVHEEVIGGLVSRARALFPELEGAAAAGAAGVRAATPDGLPLVGPSRAPGLVLALGARRNGWLLALDIAEAVLDQLAGAAPSDAYRPDRFGGA
jgi:glycine oxidase